MIPSTIECRRLDFSPRKFGDGVVAAMKDGGEVYVLHRPGSPRPVRVSQKSIAAIRALFPPPMLGPGPWSLACDIPGWPEMNPDWSHLVIGPGVGLDQAVDLFLTQMEHEGIKGTLLTGTQTIRWMDGNESELRILPERSSLVEPEEMEWAPPQEVVDSIHAKWNNKTACPACDRPIDSRNGETCGCLVRVKASQPVTENCNQ